MFLLHLCLLGHEDYKRWLRSIGILNGNFTASILCSAGLAYALLQYVGPLIRIPEEQDNTSFTPCP
jgi:hypothetical protein